MKKLVTLVLMLFITIAFAKDVQKSIDWAIFQSEGSPVIELYYSLNQNDLTFLPSEDGFASLFVTQLSIEQNDKVVQSFAFKNQRSVQDTAFIQDSDVILDQLHFPLDPGNYTLRFFIRDLNNEQLSDTTIFDMIVPEPSTSACFSDIELAGSIRKADQASLESRFYKNTLLVEPNPSLIYSIQMPMLFFYTELYNLPSAVQNQPYVFSYLVTDKAGNPVETVAERQKKRSQSVENQVEYGFINLGKVPSGIYNLVLEIIQNEKIVAKQSKEFVMYREDMIAVEESDKYSSSIIAFMDTVSIEREFDYIFYILSKEDRKIYKNINEIELKRQYLYDFWHRKNQQIPVKNNPLRTEFLRRIDYANENFRAYKKEGWRTDRGRVYVVYGKPNELDRHPSEATGAPWVEWKYHNLQGGVSFIFADLDDWNDYQLLHSDLYGEIQNYDYIDIIRKGSY